MYAYVLSICNTILNSVGSVGASLLLWVAGFFLSFCGLFIWLKFGTMFPCSRGKKMHLEAVYRHPKYLATVVFSTSAIILGFSASNCIVNHFPNIYSMLCFTGLVHRSSLKSMNKDFSKWKKGLTNPISILVSAGHSADHWVVCCIAIRGIYMPCLFPKISAYIC